MTALPARPPHQRALALPAALLLAAHLGLALPLPADWRGAAAHLAVMMPGALTALLLFRATESGLERLFLALCGALAAPTLILLPVHALPGPVPWWAPLAVADALSAWLGWLLWRDRAPAADSAGHAPLGAAAGAALVAVLALGAALRLPALGGAEFQGDEGRAILMAADLLHGADDILLLHKKGPLEVLLPAVPLVVTGRVSELTARVPFALAGLAALLGAFVLARRLFAPPGQPPGVGVAAGLLAALALALDGFMIGFSRIVQYQSVVVALGMGAAYCGWRFYQGAPHPRRPLAFAAALSAVALLAHFDALFALPALGLLVLAGAARRGWGARQWAGHLLPPALLAAGLVASFFVPFALHPRFGRTLEYLTGRAGQGESLLRLYGNLAYYADVSTFYNTTFAMAALGAAVLCGALAWLLMYVRPRPLGAALAALLAGGALLQAAAPERLQLGEHLNAGALVFGLPLAALALAPRTPAGLRAAVIWFAAGFVGQSFLVARPNTHFYVMHAPAALLVGLALTRLLAAEPGRAPGRAAWSERSRAASRLRAVASSCLRVSQLGLIAAGVPLALLSAAYAYVLFVRQEPEYRRTFPEHRAPIFRAGYGDDVPSFANFGFPHRAGWKAVGELYARGVIRGSYIANEEELITGWYVRGAFRCPNFADYVLLATHPLDRVRVDEGEVRDTYHLLGIVTTDGVGKMEIWSRAPIGAEPRAFALEDLAASFDERPVADFPTQRSLAEEVPLRRLDALWPQGIRLAGYDVVPQPGAGGPLDITLYWRTPLAPESGGNDYLPRVELLDASGQVAAAAEPTCEDPGQWYYQWLSGVSYRVPAGLPAGEYALRVGLRRPDGGAALPLADGREWLPAGTVAVGGPPAPAASGGQGAP